MNSLVLRLINLTCRIHLQLLEKSHILPHKLTRWQVTANAKFSSDQSGILPILVDALSARQGGEFEPHRQGSVGLYVAHRRLYPRKCRIILAQLESSIVIENRKLFEVHGRHCHFIREWYLFSFWRLQTNDFCQVLNPIWH